MESWYRVKLSINRNEISDEWFEGNIKDKYKCYGMYYWYFKDKGDAATFVLRWKGV